MILFCDNNSLSLSLGNLEGVLALKRDKSPVLEVMLNGCSMLKILAS